MEGIDVELVGSLNQISRNQVKRLLRIETPQLELTKSLLNLLHNIVRVGSVNVTPTQRKFFDKHSDLVLGLLSKSKSLRWKKAQLEQNIPLVLNIAASCPRVVG